MPFESRRRGAHVALLGEVDEAVEVVDGNVDRDRLGAKDRAAVACAREQRLDQLVVDSSWASGGNERGERTWGNKDLVDARALCQLPCEGVLAAAVADEEDAELLRPGEER